MMKRKLLLAMAAVVVLGVACDKTSSKEQAPPVAVSSLSAPARSSAVRVLSSYEDIRTTLARDAVAGVSASAEKLEAAASELAAASPASMKPHASALAAVARSLKSETDIEKARVLFGDLSRQVISLLVIEPALREDLKIYECPMAQGYKKWVQPKPEIENPYMGKAMLQCGSASEWAS